MKNPYAEAIGQLFSGKNLKPVIIWIVQNNPATFCKAFKACYPVQDAKIKAAREVVEEMTTAAPKFDAYLAKAENDANILSLARPHKMAAIALHSKIYRSNLKEAKEAVEKMLAEDEVQP